VKRLIAATALLISVTSFSWAQATSEHEGHHPPDKGATAAAASASPAAKPGMSGSQGMMGGGGMMSMMENMPMMRMMGMMGQSGEGMGGMAMIDHVEGRIAFLRTELKITEGQTGPWNAFAEALRGNAKSLSAARGEMMPTPGTATQTLTDRLALQEKWLSARLEGIRAIRPALASLVSTFSDDQKKTAEEILAPHIGVGAMMQGGPAGQMSPGSSMPGRMMKGQ